MKIIVYEGSNKFSSKKCEGTTEDNNIIKFIKQHKFYHESFHPQQILKQIKQKACKIHQQNNQVRNKIQQLSLYLNNQKNKSMFQIYEIVLKNPKGVTYKDIDNKVKIGIVSVSHYCCRLKKMNFVQLRHQKNQKVVYPKDNTMQKKTQEQEQPNNIVKHQKSTPFHFQQLSMVDNIWVNVSSYESYKKNGITNEDIKEKLCKTSETKLIMKLVDQVGAMYQFDREMVSEGKVFQNRFRNFTKKIVRAAVIEPTRKQIQIEQKLNPRIQNWLKIKFPQFQHQRFLLNLINSELKDYLSASGLKSARRNCTPIKLTRYIKILNSLNHHYPQTHIQLKNFIIEEQKQIANGTMHKRSILGILDGLVTKGVLKKIQPYYYPLWQPQGQQIQINNQQQKNGEMQSISKPKKKVKLTSLTTKKQITNKVGLKQYKNELKTRLFFASLQQIQFSILKSGFKNIKKARLYQYQQKKMKNQIKLYEPDTHILNYLQGENYKKLPKLNAKNYEQFVLKIDQFVENQGTKQQPININYQIIKTMRKCERARQTDLRARFGNNLMEKISSLVESKIIHQEDGYWVLKADDRYFI